MEWVLLIVLGAAALLGIVKVFFDKPDDPRRLRAWRIGFAISALLLSAAIINFFIHPPLTKEDVKEVLCEWDPYKEKVSELAGKSEITPEEKRQLKEAAECLAEIAVNAMDSGLVAIGLGNYDKAITHLNYVIQAAQYDSLIGESFFLRGAAFFFWAKSLADAPDDSLTLLLTEALDSYDSALTYDYNLHYVYWYARSIGLAELGRHEEAVTCYDSFLTYEHNVDEAWYNRGITLHHLKRYEEAVASYDSALTYRHDNQSAWNNRAGALIILERYDEAIASCDSALSYKHDNQGTWYNRGVALYQLGHYEKALASCDSALKYDPNMWEAVELREIILEEMKE